MTDALQSNARDPKQQREAADQVAILELRRRSVIRESMSTAIGRELWSEVILPLFAIYARYGGTPEDVYGQIALHNRGCDALESLQEHREFYLQMNQEFAKRQKARLDELRSMATNRTRDDDE